MNIPDGANEIYSTTSMLIGHYVQVLYAEY